MKIKKLLAYSLRLTAYGLLAVSGLLLALSPAIAESGSLADPMRIGVGARSMGMGKAYVGLAEDGDALFLNPAGIAKTANLKISSMYSKLLNEIDYAVLGGVYPLGESAIGVGYVLSQSGDIVLRDSNGAQTGTAGWNAQVLSLAYATKLNKVLKALGDKEVLAGGSIKYYSSGTSGYSASDSGLDLDLGLLYPLNNSITLGLNAQNVLPTTMSNSGDEIPSVYKVGGKVAILGEKEKALLASEQKLNLALDFDLEKSGTSTHLGVELWPLQNLALRAGSDSGNLTAGIGLRFAGLEFNYAYHPNPSISEGATHYFSFGYLGLPKVSEKKAENSVEIITASPVQKPPLSEIKPQAKLENKAKVIKAKNNKESKVKVEKNNNKKKISPNNKNNKKANSKTKNNNSSKKIAIH